METVESPQTSRLDDKSIQRTASTDRFDSRTQAERFSLRCSESKGYEKDLVKRK